MFKISPTFCLKVFNNFYFKFSSPIFWVIADLRYYYGYFSLKINLLRGYWVIKLVLTILTQTVFGLIFSKKEENIQKTFNFPFVISNHPLTFALQIKKRKFKVL